MSLVLFGIKKSGKHYYGKLIAKRLRYSLVDTDELIERQFFKEQGQKLSCKQIYYEIGDEQYRLLERKAIMGLNFITHAVILIGQGTLLDPMNVSHLSKIGPFIFFKSAKRQTGSISSEIPISLGHPHVSGFPLEPNKLKVPSFANVLIISLETDNQSEEEVLTQLEQLAKAYETKPPLNS